MEKYDLLFDVRARVSIANLCKDKKFENIQYLFDCAEADRIKNILKILKIMSNSAEYRKRKAQGLEVNFNADYNAIPLTEADLYELMPYELNVYEEQIAQAIKDGSEQTVETKEPKKSKKKDSE